jgi:RHS repeat-associated protein
MLWQTTYAFGMLQPNRSFFDADGGGTYGFNGMLKDDEISGNGNSSDFGARLYNPRIGRWFSRDPKSYVFANISPYVFVSNNLGRSCSKWHFWCF